ncbi:MAG: DUF378 domain-containing protein [Patescibacteria group bacterium]
MKKLHCVTYILLVVGGLNWLLVGLIKWDIGELFGGQGAAISRIVYLLVGVSAVIELVTHKGSCKHCETTPTPVQPEAPKPTV